jgi:hypothetical protein
MAPNQEQHDESEARTIGSGFRSDFFNFNAFFIV